MKSGSSGEVRKMWRSPEVVMKWGRSDEVGKM